MKKWFLALAMGLSMVACTNNTATAAADDDENVPAAKTAKDFVPSAKEIRDVSYLVGINFGSFIKGYNFGDLDFAQIRKGMEDFINAKGDQRSEEFAEQFRVNPNEMNEIFNNYLENRRNYTLYSNKEKEDKFMKANAKKAGVQVSPTGLQYKIINAGSDVKPVGADTVWVRYKGTLLDGTVFDQTPEDGDAARFTLNRVVKGWSEGMSYIGEGGEIELYIPAALGYGDNGTRGIDPGATLIFNVSVEKVGKVK